MTDDRCKMQVLVLAFLIISPRYVMTVGSHLADRFLSPFT